MTYPSALRWQDSSKIVNQISKRPPTPLIPVVATIGDREFTIKLKLESASAWGSVKDRTALGLVSSIAGKLDNPQATMIESTSGNLGTALSHIARHLNRRFIAVVDVNLSPTLAATMTSNGAHLEFVTQADRHGGYLGARLARVAQLLNDIPNAIWTDQYHNTANPEAHYASTAPEVMRQEPYADSIFVAVSTGGTLAGISRYTREHYPWIRMVAVDVPGSSVFAKPTGPRLLTGIGAGIKSSFLSPGAWDDVVLVKDRDAIAVCHRLREATGISLGGSGGAAVAACLRYVADNPNITTPVCICPDSGLTYALTIYNKKWLNSKSIDPSSWDPSITFHRHEGDVNGE